MAGTAAVRGSRSGRLRAHVTVALAVILVPLTPASAGDGVRTTRALETQPSAVRGYLAWTQRPNADSEAYTVYLKPAGAAKRRVNAKGTKGFTTGGAVDESGTTVAFGQRVDAVGNVKLYDIATRRRRNPPAGVNTRRGHEWGASISGDWLLFGRGRCCESMKVLLFNLATGEKRRLASATGGTLLQPEDVTGRYATFTRCVSFKHCRVVRYDIRTKRSTVLPNPNDRSQFGSSVLADGTVFYGESGNIATCRSRLRLFRQPMSGSRQRLETLGEGLSIATTSPQPLAGGRVALHYDPARCDGLRADIHRAIVAR